MQDQDPDIRQFVYAAETVGFVAAANEVCMFLEDVKGMEGKAFIRKAVMHLSAVYHAMLVIGETEPVLESAFEPTITEQDWSFVYQRIAGLLGPFNDILRPADEGEFDRSELVPHTISEDLADVYQELKDFTTIYSRGMEELMNDAAWELKVRFAEHWGGKLLRSLSALHNLYVTGADPAEQ